MSDGHSASKGKVLKVETRSVRIWIVSELYYPEETSTGHFITGIAEGLAQHLDVRVLCSQPTYSNRGVRALRKEVHNGVFIHRVRSTSFDKNRLLLRAINMVTFSIAVFAFLLLRARARDKVIVVTNPPLIGISVALASKVRRLCSVLLVHDVFPSTLVAAGLLTEKSILFRLVKSIMGLAYRAFSKVVVLGRDMRSVVVETFSVSSANIAIIPNWGDVEEVDPAKVLTNRFSEAHGLTNKFVVQFAGNIGRTHDIDVVLNAASHLADESGIIFVIITDGSKESYIRQRVYREHLTNVMVIPRQPRPMLPDMLCSASVALIAFEDSMLGLSVPSRMYNIMAAEVPIIALADPRSELAMCVRECGCGWTLPVGDELALSSLLRDLAQPYNEHEVRLRGQSGRKAALENYTKKTVVESFRKLID